MEQKAKFTFVHPDVSMACPSTLEAANNHFVANTDVELVRACPPQTVEFKWGWDKVNAKLCEMFKGGFLYDYDVRDLYTMVEEMNLHKQWTEMNEKIRAELEVITEKVEASKKMLDENPPEMKYWAHRGFFPYGYGYRGFPMLFQKSVPAPEPEPEVQPEPVPEPEPLPVDNTWVANANVSEIVPAPLKVVYKMEGSWSEKWNKMMEDCLAMHQWGVYGPMYGFGFPRAYGFNGFNNGYGFNGFNYGLNGFNGFRGFTTDFNSDSVWFPLRFQMTKKE